MISFQLAITLTNSPPCLFLTQYKSFFNVTKSFRHVRRLTILVHSQSWFVSHSGHELIVDNSRFNTSAPSVCFYTLRLRIRSYRFVRIIQYMSFYVNGAYLIRLLTSFF